MGAIVGSALAIAAVFVIYAGVNRLIEWRFGEPRPRLAAGIMLILLLGAAPATLVILTMLP